MTLRIFKGNETTSIKRTIRIKVTDQKVGLQFTEETKYRIHWFCIESRWLLSSHTPGFKNIYSFYVQVPLTDYSLKTLHLHTQLIFILDGLTGPYSRILDLIWTKNRKNLWEILNDYLHYDDRYWGIIIVLGPTFYYEGSWNWSHCWTTKFVWKQHSGLSMI